MLMPQSTTFVKSQLKCIISTGVLIVGLSRKMRKQGVRISPPVEDGQELSYICVYIAILSVCFKIGVN